MDLRTPEELNQNSKEFKGSGSPKEPKVHAFCIMCEKEFSCYSDQNQSLDSGCDCHSIFHRGKKGKVCDRCKICIKKIVDTS